MAENRPEEVFSTGFTNSADNTHVYYIDKIANAKIDMLNAQLDTINAKIERTNEYLKIYNQLYYQSEAPILFSGVYDDLENKPDLSVYAIEGNLSTVALSGSYNDLDDKPILFSGNYTDLTNKPEIPDISGKQDALVSGTNIKTINGKSVLGAGDISITTNYSFPVNWPTSHNTTTKDFCDVVNADPTAVQGMTYLGEVRWSDLPFNGNAEVVVEIMDGTGTSNKVIHLILTSSNIAPYRWEYTYWVNGNGQSQWLGYQPELISGTNIKTINGVSLLGSGDIEISGGSSGGSVDWNDVQNKPTIPTKMSELQNDVGYLDNYPDLEEYALVSSVPIKVSDLTNDSGYMTSITDDIESTSFDYIHDEESWNESYANGGLKQYYANNPDEDRYNFQENRWAWETDKLLNGEWPDYCVQCWQGAISANGAKYPWIVPHFDYDVNAKIKFVYEGKEAVHPWGDRVFGIGRYTNGATKLVGCASVAEEFQDNSFLISENAGNGDQNWSGIAGANEFDITKFKMILEPQDTKSYILNISKEENLKSKKEIERLNSIIEDLNNRISQIANNSQTTEENSPPPTAGE